MAMVSADRLPESVPENQIFTSGSVIEAVGSTTESTSLVWQTSDKGLETLPNPYFSDGEIKSGSIAYVTYKDTTTTNGGQISEVKSFSMDTHEKTEGLYNIQTEKALTYTSQNGSHLIGAESYVLDVAGNWSRGVSDIVCVFARSEQEIIPAFCNKVTASSKLMSVTTAQVESSGSLTAVGSSPAALNYEIAVTPDANSASGYAEGIVSTTFTVSVMEGRSDGKVTDGVNRGLWKHRWMDSGEGILDWSGDKLNKIPTFQFIMDPANPKDYTIYLNAGFQDERYLHKSGWSPPGFDILENNVPGIVISWTESGYIMKVEHDLSGLPAGTYTINSLNSDINAAVILQNPTTIGLEHYDELAATITAIDTATVVGGISQFVKAFNYQSGVECDKC